MDPNTRSRLFSVLIAAWELLVLTVITPFVAVLCLLLGSELWLLILDIWPTVLDATTFQEMAQKDPKRLELIFGLVIISMGQFWVLGAFYPFWLRKRLR